MNPIIVCGDKKTQSAMIRVVGETSGVWPFGTRNTATVDRSLYAPTPNRLIINFTRNANMLELLGNPSSAGAIVVDDVSVAVEKAKAIFGEYGIKVETFDDLEPEFPKGLIVFMTIETLPHYVLLFWPPPPPTANISNVPPPKPWTPDELLKE